MRTYEAFYRGKRLTVQAISSRAAQLIAAQRFKARKEYEVTVILADVVHDPAIL